MAINEDREEHDTFTPPYLHLISAFLAMEPPDVMISLARECGGGFIGDRVQSFIWNGCICEAMKIGLCQGPYLRRVLKKLIAEIESERGVVLDELYEHYAYIMASSKDDNSAEGKSKIVKKISFLFPDDCAKLLSCPKSKKLEVSLQCSLNLLEGDTGCSIWPSSLYLAEFVLSFPELFFNKSCLEVGSGVGLLGVCLAHVKASSIILSDGDLSTLVNMRQNVESNLMHSNTNVPEVNKDPTMVQCVHLPWESATETELRNYAPDIVLGADVIYDPVCLPHLVRVLSILLKGSTPYDADKSRMANQSTATCSGRSFPFLDPCPVAYIAYVIRNLETYNCFLRLTEEANLCVTDMTEAMQPVDLLPYAKSYERSRVRIFSIAYL